MAQALYRGMNRAAIDRQLNLRARWPDHEGAFARWARESADIRANLACRLDLAYDAGPGGSLDFFPAPGGSGALLAFIHGGYWQSLDKGDFSYLAPAFVEAGTAFASLNYRLAPEAKVGEIVAQVRRSLAWLHRQAGTLGFDPGRLFVAGHSAGGHLALMAAATDWAREGPDLPADTVKGVCSVSGVYDLRPVRLSYHQEVLDLTAADAEVLSPLLHVPERAPPLICAVGSEETEEFLFQQDQLIEAWGARGLNAVVIELPGRQHFTAVDALGEPGHDLFQAVRGMLLGPP